MGSPYDDAVKRELGAVPMEERLPPRMTMTQAGYTEEPGKHVCQECWMFIEDQEGVGRCALVEGVIRAEGTCNFFKAGQYMAATRWVENDTKVGQSESGYMERREGFACATCVRYRAAKRRCAVVYGPIAPTGCCNYWSDERPWVGAEAPESQEVSGDGGRGTEERRGEAGT